MSKWRGRLMDCASNHILHSLPADEVALISKLLRTTTLKQHTMLFDVLKPIERVYFPHNAVISLVVPLSSGEVVEVAMAGRDGVVGASAVVNDGLALCRAVVQMEGTAQECDVVALCGIVDRCP